MMAGYYQPEFKDRNKDIFQKLQIITMIYFIITGGINVTGN